MYFEGTQYKHFFSNMKVELFENLIVNAMALPAYVIICYFIVFHTCLSTS